ncbi:MAG TPA: LytTR family DNA-binding domain-containing protein [Bacteroidales bacterium]|jgi:two-component system LytT family response regulator|nr:LytTR family DNA-binding domain-containing protein [Bacteroidales bacterium]
MNLKCIAIDDEPLALKQIGNYIEKTPFLELVALCNNAFTAMEYLKKDNVDLLLVDISMPDLSGLDFVKALSSKPFIIFTTAFSEYAIEGFRVDATDYLLKPIGYNEFLRSVNKVKDLAGLVSSRNDNGSPMDHIYVKSGYKVVRIDLDDIKYIESMHEYVRFHLISTKPVMTLASMKSIEEMLPESKFLRVHRSYIVNTEKIRVIERNRIVFDNTIYIPVSDQYKTKFQEFLNKNSLE